MKLIPLFYFTKTDKVHVLWCKYINSRHYDSKWMGEKFHDIDAIADCDIVERDETFDSLEEAHDAVVKHFQGLK